MQLNRFAVGPEPFARANARLQPLLQDHGFRLASLEVEREGKGNAFAEYFRREWRLRLVWAAEEEALWVEAARQSGAAVISRWRDVEWDPAGTPRPLDRDTSDARIDRLLGAVENFLAGAPSRR